MADRIFLSRSDDGWTEAAETPFETEAELQTLIAEHPELLCGDQLDPANPRRWLLIREEMPVPQGSDGGHWRIDLLFVDQDAIPALVEVKRGGNAELERTVVGQLLQYAGQAASTNVQDFRTAFEQRMGDPARAESELAAVLEHETDADAFWARVGANLKARRLQLLFVADAFPESLLNTVELLGIPNSDMGVAAVEVKQYMDTTGKIYVSRLLRRLSDVSPVPQSTRSVGTTTNRKSSSAGRASQTPPGHMTPERLMTLIPEHAHDAVGRLFKTAIEHKAQVWGERQETVIGVSTAAWKDPVKIAFFTPLDGKDAKNAWGRNATFGFGAGQFRKNTPPGDRLGEVLNRWGAYFKQAPYATNKGKIRELNQLWQIEYDVLPDHVGKICELLATTIDELKALPSE